MRLPIKRIKQIIDKNLLQSHNSYAAWSARPGTSAGWLASVYECQVVAEIVTWLFPFPMSNVANCVPDWMNDLFAQRWNEDYYLATKSPYIHACNSICPRRWRWCWGIFSCRFFFLHFLVFRCCYLSFAYCLPKNKTPRKNAISYGFSFIIICCLF